MSTTDPWDLLFHRDDLSRHEVRDGAPAALAPGQARLAVERFGVTTLTATYALFGDSPLRFFDVFPAPAGRARVPVWGFARVVESRAPGVAEGARVFGYLPMSTHHVVTPDATADGFVDAGQDAVPHDWYRTYRSAPAEDGAEDDLDDRRALLRPLFPCSFTLSRVVGGQAADGVGTVLLSSASCKTAIGLAHLLARHDGVTTVGVTSAANTAFTRGLGLYDTVLGYDDLGRDAVPGPAVFVDFTNSADRVRAVYRHAGARLAATFLAGFTHPSRSFAPPDVGDPQPQPYFTPAVEEQVVAEVGADTYELQYRQAELDFVTASRSWLEVRRGAGPDAMAEAVGAALAGTVRPATGAVLTP